MKVPSLRFIALILIGVSVACRDKTDVTPSSNNATTPDWTEATHSNKTAPSYSVVFPQNQVNSIEIRMTTADWTAIREDMKLLKGADFGAGGMGGGNVNTTTESDRVYSFSTPRLSRLLLITNPHILRV